MNSKRKPRRPKTKTVCPLCKTGWVTHKSTTGFCTKCGKNTAYRYRRKMFAQQNDLKQLKEKSPDVTLSKNVNSWYKTHGDNKKQLFCVYDFEHKFKGWIHRTQLLDSAKFVQPLEYAFYIVDHASHEIIFLRTPRGRKLKLSEKSVRWYDHGVTNHATRTGKTKNTHIQT